MFICDIPRVIQVIFAFWGHSKQFNELFLKKIEKSKNLKYLKCLKKCSPRSGNEVKYVIRLTQHSCFIPRCSILSCMHIPTYHLNTFYLLLNMFYLLPWPLGFFQMSPPPNTNLVIYRRQTNIGRNEWSGRVVLHEAGTLILSAFSFWSVS